MSGRVHWRAGFPAGRAACGAGYGDTIARMTDVQSEVTCKLCRVYLGLDKPTPPKRSDKPRASPVRGVRQSAQAFCTKCNWYGAHWYGNGSWNNAAGELAWHKDQAKCDSAD